MGKKVKRVTTQEDLAKFAENCFKDIIIQV
jgi:hypothetical protein